MSEKTKCLPWRCPNGHILGMVTRDGNHVRTLEVFRQAQDYHDDQIVDVCVKVKGSTVSIDVTCSICGSVRPWEPGQEYINKIINGKIKHMHERGEYE
jgi:hypothetical protein